MTELGEGNIAAVGADADARRAPRPVEGSTRRLHLVAAQEFLDTFGDRIPDACLVTPRTALDPPTLIEAVARGDSLIWIGDGEDIPAELWVGTFRPAEIPLAVTVPPDDPLVLGDLDTSPARLTSAYLHPVKEMPLHNIDEEPRADLLPVLEARDRFGRVVGYPGVLMSHHAASLAGGRFAEAECLFVLFDEPGVALPTDAWVQLLETMERRFQCGVQLATVQSDYARYRPGERGRIRARVQNAWPNARAVELRWSVRGPGDAGFRPVVRHRRCPPGGEASEAVLDLPTPDQPGLWTVRVEACQDPASAEELSLPGHPEPVDRREIGIVVLDGDVETPDLVQVDGPRIRIGGRDGFWVGTHYYPSSSWWDWLWRDLRPATVARDLAAIREAGYRIVRIWVDPHLDEQTLRAMDAVIWIAAQEELVVDVCIFNQWVDELGFERTTGDYVSWTYRQPREGNIYGFSLHHLELQKEYAQVLARRWKAAGNVVYNLANEAYIKDPDHSQMDPEIAAWDGNPPETGTLRDSVLFRRWADSITDAMRQAGAGQAVVAGYLFSLSGGGDAYLANRSADIAAWHSYQPEHTASMLTYFDPVCSQRPVMLQEFGALGWNDADGYDLNVHAALAAGAAAAVSYEWGVSWLARDMGFHPVPLRAGAREEPDPRWFEPYRRLGEVWPSRAVGICPTPSGFGYGSIHHGTPFPAEAAVALGRLGWMGSGLGRAARPESTYLLVPTAADVEVIASVTEAIRKLWRMKAVFGVWQEDRLDGLPDGAQILICPAPPSLPDSHDRLEVLRRSGVRVLDGPVESWTDEASPQRLQVAPGDGVDLLLRRTVSGTLYSLRCEEGPRRVELTTEQGTSVVLGLSRFGMVHEPDRGAVDLLEASDEVSVDGRLVCRAGRGRFIIASRDGLTDGRSIRLTVTGPTALEFPDPVVAWAVVDGRTLEPAGFSSHAGGHVLDADEEMCRYPLQVELNR